LKLTFLGTRGGIQRRSRRHRLHSAVWIEQGAHRIMIDCGSDWRRRVARLTPEAILVTHAHEDHSGGLSARVRVPVYASATTRRALRSIVDVQPLAFGSPVSIAQMRIEAFPVVHSRVAPAVGYRIAGRVCYVPDVVDIRDKSNALGGIELYIGDGARLTRPLVRRTSTGRRFGHTPIATQLRWCARIGIRRAIFTHCGTEIVRDHERADEVVRELGRQHAIDARLAYDGLTIDA
jgi:phosphoribosyl 1,2-cyclic phosphodiesterase